MKNQVLIDWLSFSVPMEMTEDELKQATDYFFGKDFGGFVKGKQTQKNKQRMGWYSDLYTLYGTGSPLIHILTGPTSDNNENTTLFHVTGYGLSDRPDALNLEIIPLLKKIRDVDGQLTRADLAIDDFTGRPILKKMTEASHQDVWRDRIITTFRFRRVHRDWSTLYYGDNPRGNQIIAYDKAAETGTADPWFRCEFRARDRKLLKNIHDDLLSGIPVAEVAANLIHTNLRFVPPGRKVKYNRKTEAWWTDFIGDAKKYTFARHRSGKDSDEPPKAPTGASAEKYLRNALRGDKSAEIEDVILRLAAEIQELRSNNVPPATSPLIISQTWETRK